MKLLDLINDLEENRNELLAESMSKYMQDKFRFLGVRGASRPKIYKKYFPEARKSKEIDWEFIENCWNKEEREFQYVVVYYLKTMQKFLKREDISRLKYLIVTKSWWDTVDLLAKVVGSLVICIEGYDQRMLEWSKDNKMWLKRVAILYQLSLKEKVDEIILDKILVNNLGDIEFFINKAIGWALRDYSKYNPEWVKEFIRKNKDNMANLSIREASKYI